LSVSLQPRDAQAESAALGSPRRAASEYWSERSGLVLCALGFSHYWNSPPHQRLAPFLQEFLSAPRFTHLPALLRGCFPLPFGRRGLGAASIPLVGHLALLVLFPEYL